MHRMLLCALVGASLGLTACSDDDDDNGDVIEPPPVALSRIVYDPLNGQLPLPNDLLLNGSPDGTLELPGEASGNYGDPAIAPGSLDGWSTIFPVSIDVMPADEERSLDGTSVQTPGAVRLFEVALGGALSRDAECTQAPTLSICKVGDELVFGQDYVSVANDNSINIVPLVPLEASQAYAYIVTDMVLDSVGDMVAPSETYEQLKQDITTDPVDTPALFPLQALVNNYEKFLSDAHGIDTDTITYSGVFTTQSIADPFELVRSLMVSPDPAHAPFQPGLSAPMPIYRVPGVEASGNLTPADLLGLKPAGSVDCAAGDLTCLTADLGDLYSAELTIAQFTPLPFTEEGPDGEAVIVNEGRWTALGDSPVSVLLALESGTLAEASFAEQAAEQGIDPTAALTDPSLLVGASFTLDNGEPVDPLRHLTRYNPVPLPVGRETIPVQMVIPNADRLTAFYAAQGVEYTPPAGGWPAVVALHGVSTTKEFILPEAGSHVVKGVALVSIDNPLHGARGVDEDGDGIFEVSATDPGAGAFLGTDAYQFGSAFNYFNLGVGVNALANVRQGIVDQLALRLALTGLAAELAGAGAPPLLNDSRTSLKGHSLGAILAAPISALASGWNEALGPNPYDFSATALLTPVGGLAGALAGSPTYGPAVDGALLAAAAAEVEEVAACLDPDTGEVIETPECAAVAEATLTQLKPPFLFSTQLLLDAVDPANYAEDLVASDQPLLSISVVGDLEFGGVNPPDQSIVATLEGFPLTGTEPFVALLGLPAVSETLVGGEGLTRGAVRFIKGQHSSPYNPFPTMFDDPTFMVDPDDAARVTAEMQTQVADFAVTDGQTISITDGCMILDAPCVQ